jgi:hypothetical protein
VGALICSAREEPLSSVSPHLRKQAGFLITHTISRPITIIALLINIP